MVTIIITVILSLPGVGSHHHHSKVRHHTGAVFTCCTNGFR